MNVATIGSGVIVERMIEAMRLDGRYNLYCVYSRTKKRAKEFAEKHGIQKYYTDVCQQYDTMWEWMDGTGAIMFLSCEAPKDV